MKLMTSIRNTICVVILVITAFGCAGTKVKFADAPIERLDLERGRTITGSASGFQLFLLIPIGINGRQAEAYTKLKMAAGNDHITDIKVQESWKYALVGTVHITTLIATAYPEKTGVPTATAKGDLQKIGQMNKLSTAERLLELKELKDNGVLTEQEYEIRRKALVEQL